MIDISILPRWYTIFLEKYNLLKNDFYTLYLIAYLEEVSDKLGTCTLLRLDDEDKNEFLSLQKSTVRVREFLKRYRPDFNNIDSSIVIGRSGFCRTVDEFSYSVLLFVKNGNQNELWFIDTDSSLKPKRITNNFDSFIVNPIEVLEKANSKVKIEENKVFYTRVKGELVPLDVLSFEIKTNIKAVKSLNSILNEKMYIHFDAEGFYEIHHYESILQKLLNMTNIESNLSISNTDKKLIIITVKSNKLELNIGLTSDYFEEDIIISLNNFLLTFGLKKKFQIIYPYTFYNGDQTMVIGFCNEKEINILTKYGYIR